MLSFRSFALMAVLMIVLGVYGGCAPAEDAELGAEAPPMKPVASDAAVEMEPAAEPMEATGITAESLVGSTWTVADYSVTFEADGVVRFNSGSEGTWTLADDTITIAVGDEQTLIQVEDDTLMHNGMALEQQ